MMTTEAKLRKELLEYLDDTRRLARRLPRKAGSRAHEQAHHLMAATEATLELLMAQMQLDEAREKYEQQMVPPRPSTTHDAKAVYQQTTHRPPGATSAA